MIKGEFAQGFVLSWLDAWNSHDLDAIFSHYDDDFEMHSPLIVERLLNTKGILKGKSEVGPYWSIGLRSNPPLKFELVEYFSGVNSISIVYKSIARKWVSEVLFFNAQGLVIKGFSHHGKPV
ncbi:MAG: nuclear transport factor 2 family protein [Oceanicoccus sp.]